MSISNEINAMKTDSSIEGAYLEPLDMHILIVRSGWLIKRICLRRKPTLYPTSHLAKLIIDHIMGGPRPALNLDTSGFTDFQRAVYKAVLEIPRGSTATYGEIARIVGRRGAARAVGMALNKNPFPIMIPCHRVVSANGIGGYSQGVDIKRRLLVIELKCSQEAYCLCHPPTPQNSPKVY